MSFVPLVEVRRGEELESLHLGWALLLFRNGKKIAWGNAEEPHFVRSALKPIQALPLVESGALEHFSIPPEELALVCASHAGEACHLAAVQSLLARLGLSEEALQCGVHPPLDPVAAQALLAKGESPGPLHNNCAGKHAGMLALARFHGWPLEGYLAPEHPVQSAIRAAIRERCETEPTWAIDGCGVPVWRMPLEALARGFLHLEEDISGRRILDAMTAFPRLVSGTNRPDTLLMEAGRGDLVAKSGGEGVHAGLVRSQGVAWAVKILDGNKRAILPLVLAMLEGVGVPLPSLGAEKAPFRLNSRGERIGQIRSLISFPA